MGMDRAFSRDNLSAEVDGHCFFCDGH